MSQSQIRRMLQDATDKRQTQQHILLKKNFPTTLLERFSTFNDEPNKQCFMLGRPGITSAADDAILSIPQQVSYVLTLL
jgi:hypothetical protein